MGINITSWMDVGSSGAEHYYAKCFEYETESSIYEIAENSFDYEDISKDELTRKIDQKEAAYLNKKDGNGSLWKPGDETIRFNSVKQIKEEANKQFPEHDIVFFRNNECNSDNPSNLIIRNPEQPKKTGRTIRICGFEGFSSEFVNLTEGSIHEVIETPERYKDKKLQDGVWVMGVTEPVLVLRREFIYET